ncbi:hypothetical protein BN946_scf185004.g1 [Trametes cinnabarina]|uniref:Uncharacterized protein n=1 Tax=Pycnoporus cinnabarinus TaxID=5643 RepID=A0A060SL16_PYCCI|nr:hypothetical protein BN946_scf185004.g1 [Trametes cinnabarina]
MSANNGNAEETPRERLDPRGPGKAEGEQREREAREKAEQERLAKEKAENERKEREAAESRKRPAGEALRGTPPRRPAGVRGRLGRRTSPSNHLSTKKELPDFADEKEAEGAAVPGSSRGRAVWQAEPGEPGRLTGEELMQTLLVELKSARKELRTLRESAEVLLKEAEWRKAQIEAYVEYLEEEAAAENDEEYEGSSGEESEGEDSEDSDGEGEEEV